MRNRFYNPPAAFKSLPSLIFVLTVTACNNQSTPNVFTNDKPRIIDGKEKIDGAQCALDTINAKLPNAGRFLLATDQPAVFSGWAWHKTQNATSDYVVIQLASVDTNSTVYSYTSTRGHRPDVNEALGINPSLNTSFILDSQAIAAKKGPYAINLIQVWPDKYAECRIDANLVLE